MVSRSVSSSSRRIRLLPEANTSRLTSSSDPPSWKRASTVASFSPGLTMEWSALSPSARSSPSTSMDLPAPVSPVRTLSPPDSSSVVSLMVAMFRNRRLQSI